jgi:hypothetical protein
MSRAAAPLWRSGGRCSWADEPAGLPPAFGLDREKDLVHGAVVPPGTFIRVRGEDRKRTPSGADRQSRRNRYPAMGGRLSGRLTKDTEPAKLIFGNPERNTWILLSMNIL